MTSDQPILSIIVTVFNMRREAARTLYSLSEAYQEGIAAADYEVIVMDNGSTQPLSEKQVCELGDNFRYYFLDPGEPSPTRAMNAGIALARGDCIGLMIDGARICSPGLLHWARRGLEMFERSVVATLGWHLGPKPQAQSIQEGYQTAEEDRLLAGIDWPHRGYDLFAISTFAESSAEGFFRPIGESNALFLPRQLVDELGGFDDRYQLPGGGLVNLDFYERCCELEDSTLVVLLGEGTFHQVHGGMATNRLPESPYLQQALEEYEIIRGRPHSKPSRRAVYLGDVAEQVVPFLRHSLSQSLMTGPTRGSFPSLEVRTTEDAALQQWRATEEEWIETFVVIHDQELVLKCESEGRFASLASYKYLFVGPRDVSRLEGLNNLVVARELANNIETHPNLLSFTAWYAVAKNELARAPWVSLLEYDVRLAADFSAKTLSSLLGGHRLIGYLPFPLSHPMYLHATPWFIPALRNVHAIDVPQLVQAHLEGGGADIWTATTNASLSVEHLKSFVDWFDPMTHLFRHDPIGAHVHERCLPVYCLLHELENIVLPDLLEHLQERSHGILACSWEAAQEAADRIERVD